MSKTDFDNKLIRFNRKITSDKTKYLKVQKKPKQSDSKRLNFFPGRIHFTSNDGYQTIFVYQPTIEKLELKKGKGTDYFLSLKSKGV